MVGYMNLSQVGKRIIHLPAFYILTPKADSVKTQSVKISENSAKKVVNFNGKNPSDHTLRGIFKSVHDFAEIVCYDETTERSVPHV